MQVTYRFKAIAVESCVEKPSLSPVRFPFMVVPLIASSESMGSVAAHLSASICLFLQMKIAVMPISITGTLALCLTARIVADVHILRLLTKSRLKLRRCMLVVSSKTLLRWGDLRNLCEGVGRGVTGKSHVERYGGNSTTWVKKYRLVINAKAEGLIAGHGFL